MLMFTRQLGQTDLTVSALCFGGNVLGWTLDEHGSYAVLDAYFDGGGNCIDTADVYGQGASESILGRWMRNRKNRDRIVLATKLGSQMGNDPAAGGLSRRYIQQAVEASLKRLQTDVIDLYQAHRDDPNTPLAETMAALDELVQQGKVHYVGASNYSAKRLREALAVSDQFGYIRYSCLQPLYNLVNRSQYEEELESLCLEQGLGVIPYASLASGFLTGKYRPDHALPATPRAKRVQERYIHEQGFRVVEQLDRIAAAHGATVAQVALAWLIARPSITAPIASATSVEQVRKLLDAINVQLTPEEMTALNTASA